jgi:DNA-nicking Smr family endonuclease
VKKKPFHSPFEKLSGMRRQLAAPPKRDVARTANPTPDPAPARPRTEEELWAEATAGATKVDQGSGPVPRATPPGSSERRWYADLEETDALRSLSADDAPFEMGDGDELIEGRVAGLDAGLLRRLRRGDYEVERTLDLHGLDRAAARGAVERFLRESRLGGLRCVRLVHGRGLHSRDQLPVLKEALRDWLAHHRFGRHVLAFCSARQADGGAGALYVLLRRPGR